MKRPLLAVALSYVAGILAAELIALPAWLSVGLPLFIATFGLSCRRLRQILLYPLVLLAGLANSTIQTDILSPCDLRQLLGNEPHLASLKGTLMETPTLRVYEQGDRFSWRSLARLNVTGLRLDKHDWQPATGIAAITTPGSLTNFYAGQIVAATGVVALPRLPAAEGTFDYRQLLKQQGIYYSLKAESENDWEVLSSPPSVPFAERFRVWARRALTLGLPVEDQSVHLEWALTLGWKTALTEEVSEPFVRAATYHIFAVDGLRMAIVFGIFFSILRVAGLPRALNGLLLLPVIWFYVALTGWAASAIRASVMLTIVIVGWVLKRPQDPLNSLLAAAILILVWQPRQLFQAGFQLSFFVVLCLILTVPPLFAQLQTITAGDPLRPAHLRPRWPSWVAVPTRYLGELGTTSFAAWIGALPLVALYFNIVTPVSTPANMLAVPLCILVLICNLLSLALAAWFPAPAELFNHAGWFGMECIRRCSEWCAQLPTAYFYVSAPSLFTICLYYALLLGFITGWVFKPAYRAWRIGSLSAAVLLWIGIECRQALTTRLTILPVHGGTSIFCDSPGTSQDLLIDTGPSNSVQSVTKPFLRAQGVNRLPALLLSHGDIHHTGGAECIADLFNVRRVYTGPLRFRSVPYRRMLERLGQTPGLMGTLALEDRVGNWTVLHPAVDEHFARADDGAIVLLGTLGGTRVLLLSDLGGAGQAVLLQRREDLHADIVVAGLPAAGEALTERLLHVVNPKLIIISDSELPVSERAPPKLRSRLSQRGIPVLYTRDCGGVTVDFRASHWKVRSITGALLSSDDLKPNLTAANEPTERPPPAPLHQIPPTDPGSD
jgi:competence protein ComEC